MCQSRGWHCRSFVIVAIIAEVWNCMQMSAVLGGCHYNVLRRPASKSPTPTMAAAILATKSQMVRSLGTPVKSADKRYAQWQRLSS
jgi:hypothetical protein